MGLISEFSLVRIDYVGANIGQTLSNGWTKTLALNERLLLAESRHSESAGDAQSGQISPDFGRSDGPLATCSIYLQERCYNVEMPR